jgi:hypothetical protein
LPPPLPHKSHAKGSPLPPPPPLCLYSPLPLRVTDAPPQPNAVAARAARVKSKDEQKTKKQIAADVVSEYLIGSDDMAMIYVSPDPFATAFEEDLDLRKFDFSGHRTAGLCFFEKDHRLFLASMAPSTPGARVPRWRTRLRGAWLISINGNAVASITDAQAVFQQLSDVNSPGCTLLFSHPEITPDISHKGLPVMSPSDFSQFTHDQLNNRLDLLEEGLRIQRSQSYEIVESGDVLNYVTRVMKLTRGKLLRQDDWPD